jgi:hypothetical protein
MDKRCCICGALIEEGEEAGWAGIANVATKRDMKSTFARSVVT